MKPARLFGIFTGVLFTLLLSFVYTQRSYLHFLIPEQVFAKANFIGIFEDSANSAYKLDPAGATSLTVAGKVGIGTASPLSKLDVTDGTALTAADVIGTAGNFEDSTPTAQSSTLSLTGNDAVAANIGGVLGFGGNYNGTQYANWASIKGLKADATSGNYGGYLSFFTRLTGNSSAERMRIDTSGNVGIGTAGPGSKLQIFESTDSKPGGVVAADKTVLKLSRAGTGNYSYPESAEFRIGHGGPSVYGTNLDLYVNGASNTNDIPDQQAMTWAYNGNVGIGTTSPASKLDVVGIASGYETIAKLKGGTSTGSLQIYGDNFNNDTGVMLIQATAGLVLDGANGTGQMYLKSNGNVGIGTTNPTRKLDVNGQIYSSVAASDTVNSGGNFMGSGGYWSLRTGVNNRMGLDVYNGGALLEALTVLQNGNVGIGTTAPAYPLDVVVGTQDIRISGSGSLGTGINLSNSDISARNWYIAASGNNSSNGPAKGFYIRDTTAGESRLVIDTSGNVGIGMASTGYRLSVNGTNGIYVQAAASSVGITVAYASGAYGAQLAGGYMGVYGYGGTYDFYAAGAGIDYGTSSSIRWKQNIQPINNALEKVLHLNGVYYDWNADHGGKHDMGMIAEDVGKVVPEVVGWDPNAPGYATGMDYGHLTPILVEAIKEQQTQIVSLQNTMNDFISKFKAGLIETKRLVVDGVDIAKKLTELSNKVDSQQKQIDDLKKEIEDLKNK